jgi:uridine phosphorylase
VKTKSVYHLGLSLNLIEGAKYVLLPGDPDRVEKIAIQLDPESKFLARKREYTSYLCQVGEEKVLVTSTGIGGASTSIAVDELAQLGVRTYLRVGTTGAIQPQIKIGEVIITTGAVRLDGVSTHYAPIEYPAVADYEIVSLLTKAALKSKIKFHLGITVSAATFYPGQERYDAYQKYVLRTLQGSAREWEKLKALNYEMESAVLLTMTSCFGLRGGCITGVVNQRLRKEKITLAHLKKGEENVIKVATTAIKMLIEKNKENFFSG